MIQILPDCLVQSDPGILHRKRSWATFAPLGSALACRQQQWLLPRYRTPSAEQLWAWTDLQKRDTNVTKPTAVPGSGSPCAGKGTLGVSRPAAYAFSGQAGSFRAA